MNLGTAQIIRGNALALPLPDSSVDLICTSPPYFGLRSYQDAGQHYDGQIGSEATPQEFLDALIAATQEMMRVLKPSGSIFVNLGDKYAGAANQRERRGTQPIVSDGRTKLAPRVDTTPQNVNFGGIRDKSLMGIPWRYAIRCIDELGLILRAEIIWAKPNGLPESVQDRVRRSHEQWFHMVKQPRYFAAVDEIRMPHDAPPSGNTRTAPNKGELRNGVHGGRAAGLTHDGWIPGQPNPLGKLPGSVWSIPTQPLEVPPELGVDHFAAYPMEWPRRIIQGFTPNGTCKECGEGRRPIKITERQPRRPSRHAAYGPGHGANPGSALDNNLTVTITGYICSCGTWPLNFVQPPTNPAIVLDPFGGTGTTALVAKALGHTGISVDLSADYCRLAEWRTNDPGQLATALGIEKPEPIPADQMALFDDA